MEELFKYIPGRERQKIAEDWYKYGADPGVCEDMAMDLYSVEEFRQNLAKADEERCELYWGLCKVTRDGVGDWSEDFGERSDFLQLMTDVHLSKALTDFGCQGRAPSTCHGRVFLKFLALIIGAEPLIAPFEKHYESVCGFLRFTNGSGVCKCVVDVDALASN